jgi:hypothetical protein
MEKTIAAGFKLLSRDLLGGTEKNDKNIRQYRRPPGRDLNKGRPAFLVKYLRNNLCLLWE